MEGIRGGTGLSAGGSGIILPKDGVEGALIAPAEVILRTLCEESDLSPPRLSLDIILCNRPDDFDDFVVGVSETELAAASLWGCNSVGGPSARKSISSRVLLETPLCFGVGFASTIGA